MKRHLRTEHITLIGAGTCIGILIAALIVLVAMTGCGHLTSAPKPIEPRVVAMGSTNKPDADIVDCDAKGCLVRQVWLDSYFERETKWKENIPADKLIHAEGEFFRIPYLCINHNSDMRRRERLAEAAP